MLRKLPIAVSMLALAGCGVQWQAHQAQLRTAIQEQDETKIIELMDTRVVSGGTVVTAEQTALRVVEIVYYAYVNEQDAGRPKPLGALLGRLIEEAGKRGARDPERLGRDYVHNLIIFKKKRSKEFAASEVGALASTCDACITNDAAVLAAKYDLDLLLAAMTQNTSPRRSRSLCRGENGYGTQAMDVADSPAVIAVLESCGAERRSPEERESAEASVRARIEAENEELAEQNRRRVAALKQEREDYQREKRKQRERAAFDQAAAAQRYRLEHGIPEPKTSGLSSGRGGTPSSRPNWSGNGSPPDAPSAQKSSDPSGAGSNRNADKGATMETCAPADMRRPQGTCINKVSDEHGQHCNTATSYGIKFENTCSQKVSVHVCLDSSKGAPDCITTTLEPHSTGGQFTCEYAGSWRYSAVFNPEGKCSTQ